MATYSNQNRNTTSYYDLIRPNLGTTWNTVTGTWEDQTRSWAEFATISYNNASRNTASYSNQSKS